MCCSPAAAADLPQPPSAPFPAPVLLPLHQFHLRIRPVQPRTAEKTEESFAAAADVDVDADVDAEICDGALRLRKLPNGNAGEYCSFCCCCFGTAAVVDAVVMEFQQQKKQPVGVVVRRAASSPPPSLIGRRITTWTRRRMREKRRNGMMKKKMTVSKLLSPMLSVNSSNLYVE